MEISAAVDRLPSRPPLDRRRRNAYDAIGCRCNHLHLRSVSTPPRLAASTLRFQHRT